MTTALRDPKSSFVVAAHWRGAIVRGELADGDPLPVEQDLMRQFRASRGVIREALRILETEGLVEVRRGLGGGPRVRHPSISHAAHGMGISLQLGDVAVNDVWIARDRLIANAIERLARERPPSVQALTTAVDELRATVGDLDAFNPVLISVGDTAVSAAGNATEGLLVGALSHIIDRELTAAAESCRRAGVEDAIEAEEWLVEMWSTTLRHIRAGHHLAARQSYEFHADVLRGELAKLRQHGDIVDVVRGGITGPTEPRPGGQTDNPRVSST